MTELDLSAYDTRPQSWLHIAMASDPAASFDAYPYVINELINGSGEDLTEILPDADPNDLQAIGVWPEAPDKTESGFTDLLVRRDGRTVGGSPAHRVSRRPHQRVGDPHRLKRHRPWAKQQPAIRSPTNNQEGTR